MSEWPEGIPNPHDVDDHSTFGFLGHEDHHRAQEALLVYIKTLHSHGAALVELEREARERQVELKAEIEDLQAKRDRASDDADSLDKQAADARADVQALLAVRDAAQAVLDGSRNRLVYVDLQRALQGLPEHLKGQV